MEARQWATVTKSLVVSDPHREVSWDHVAASIRSPLTDQMSVSGGISEPTLDLLPLLIICLLGFLRGTSKDIQETFVTVYFLALALLLDLLWSSKPVFPWVPLAGMCFPLCRGLLGSTT